MPVAAIYVYREATEREVYSMRLLESLGLCVGIVDMCKGCGIEFEGTPIRDGWKVSVAYDGIRIDFKDRTEAR